jgi:CheY-like chemotaxis protein
VISPGKVLVVDDEQPMYEMYCDILIPDGYRVEWATDRDSALKRVQETDWDVIVLDQRLNGPTGGNTGIDLVTELSQTGAKVILSTAYADPEMAERAFREGVYDYLTKDNLKLLRTLLRIKVRSASELARERRLGALSPEAREQEIRELWGAVRSEADPQRKGKLLEDLMIRVFKTLPGFSYITVRAKNKDEEIDLIIRNESPDAFWSREGSQYILVECKNWSKPVGPDELIVFRNKLENRGARCRLGFFVALGGFTKGFDSHAATYRKDPLLIVPLNHDDIEELVNAPEDRNALLKQFHQRAAMAGNGH